MSDEKNKRLEPRRDIVDGEIVAEFGNETLMNLPAVQASPESQDEIDEPWIDEDVPDRGRRTFFARLLLGGAAALAVGGGTAVAYNRRQEKTVVILPNGEELTDEDSSPEMSALVQRVADLEYELALISAERDQYITDLSSANQENERVRMELQAALAECEDAWSLNSLWESLDAVGLDALIRAAMVIVGNALGALLTVVGLLQTGLTRGHTALDSFAGAMPGPEDGIVWLKGQVSALAGNLAWLREQVQEAIEPAEEFATTIGNFVLWVLDNLPFGIGAKARAGMEAMQAVVNTLPNLESGISSYVLDPLGEWFGDDTSTNLAGILLNPIIEHVIEPAENTLQKIADFQDTYQERLVEPVEEALAQRREIRTQIEEAQARLLTHRA